MENLFSTALVVYWIFYAILLFIAYHKIFQVYYFDLSKGFLQELVTVGFLGLILAAVSLFYWQVGLVVVIVIALMGIGKARSSGGKKAILIFAVIACIAVAVVGNQVNQSKQNTQESGTTIAQ